MGRWWLVGLLFFAIGLAVLYLFRDVLQMPLVAATALAGETTLLLRYVINGRWVFDNPKPAWTRLWQFHAASAVGAGVWWIAANTLPRYGVNYLIASAAGSACSVSFSMASNFLWVWRKRRDV